MEQGSTNRSTTGAGLSVSVIPPIFGDSQSTSEAAQRDLDAALQLLVNRAQYITGATGAAIALRRNGSKDMLCRASIGANAPELGALLSTEFGLSGESVRTRQALRCDDTERDSRVNAEICRQLGIVSVIVMPVIDDDQVLGVFELFSEKANAFGDRELSVVQRLSGMVETAVCLAEAAGSLPKPKKATAAAAGLVSNGVRQGQFVADLSQKDLTAFTTKPADDPIRKVSVEPEAAVPTEKSVPELGVSSPATDAAAVKKPLLWSAPHEDEEAAGVPDTNQALIPPVLRDLRKCVACGFPVSAGRMLCVECEEKKWRGQLRSQSNRSSVSSLPAAVAKTSGAAAAPAMAKAPVKAEGPKVASAAVTTPLTPALKNDIPSAPRVVAPSEPKQEVAASSTEPASAGAAPEFTLSSGIEPSQSWFAANKYVLIVLLAIAAAASAIYFLR